VRLGQERAFPSLMYPLLPASFWPLTEGLCRSLQFSYRKLCLASLYLQASPHPFAVL
jgi:hypothetical protein